MRTCLFILLFLITSCAVNVVKQEPTLSRDPAATGDIINLLSVEVCSSERNYFEEPIKTFFDELKNRKLQNASTDIPQVCILYSMRKFHREAERAPSDYFARCESPTGQPEKGVFKPCVTDNYWNTIHNSYADVMNCLGLDQKFYFPQIVYESGFHLNAISPDSWDAGLGMYTKRGAQRIFQGEYLDRVISAIDESDKPSCQRISQHMGLISEELIEVSNRCAFLTMPKNPYKSFVFFAIHHLRDENELRYEFAKKKLFEKIERAGWEDYNRDEMIKTISLLSYNSGVQGAIRLLNGYLDTRLRAKEKISARHFNFYQDLNFVRGRINKKKGKSGLFRKQTFPEYLWIWHRSYMSDLASIKKHFDRVLGPICTDERFLKTKEESAIEQ